MPYYLINPGYTTVHCPKFKKLPVWSFAVWLKPPCAWPKGVARCLLLRRAMILHTRGSFQEVSSRAWSFLHHGWPELGRRIWSVSITIILFGVISTHFLVNLWAIKKKIPFYPCLLGNGRVFDFSMLHFIISILCQHARGYQQFKDLLIADNDW